MWKYMYASARRIIDIIKNIELLKERVSSTEEMVEKLEKRISKIERK